MQLMGWIKRLQLVAKSHIYISRYGTEIAVATCRCRGLRVSCKSQLIEHSGSAVELLWGKGKRKERRREEKERLSSYWESAKTK